MFADITELDDHALHMRAALKKSEDYMMSFCVDFLHVSKALASGRYDPSWTLNKWLVLKLHISERHARRRIQMFKDCLAADDREKFEEQEQEARKVRAQAKEVQEQIKLDAVRKRLHIAQEREAATKEIRRIKEAARLRQVRAAKKRTQADIMSGRVRIEPAPTPPPAPPPAPAPAPAPPPEPPTTITTVRCVCPVCGDAHQAQVKKPKLTVVV